VKDNNLARWGTIVRAAAAISSVLAAVAALGAPKKW